MKPRRFWVFPFFGIGALLLGGWAVMLLWNAILPDVTGVKALTYWQAMGLLILSRILFGGWRGGGRSGGFNKHKPDFQKHAAWRDKWMNMSMEERLKFKQEWRERCKKGRWGDQVMKRPSDQTKERPGDKETWQPSDEELL